MKKLILILVAVAMFFALTVIIPEVGSSKAVWESKQGHTEIVGSEPRDAMDIFFYWFFGIGLSLGALVNLHTKLFKED